MGDGGSSAVADAAPTEPKPKKPRKPRWHDESLEFKEERRPRGGAADTRYEYALPYAYATGPVDSLGEVAEAQEALDTGTALDAVKARVRPAKRPRPNSNSGSQSP